MLESSRLLIARWQRKAPPGLSVPAGGVTPLTRWICTPDSGQFLGFACRQEAAAPAWRRWLSPATIAVYETEDASLLCHLRHAWGLSPGWVLTDADERLVGLVRRASVRDRLGRTQARLTYAPAEKCSARRTQFQEAPSPLPQLRERGDGLVWLAGNGRELARLRACHEGVLLDFADDGIDNPFTRMLLLGAAAVR